MSHKIKISVLMSVYNTQREYLVEAIDSILNQTFKDFEFIIVDDKSTDGSLNILKEYKSKDERIVLIENIENMGLTKSLNEGLRQSRGKYIARMDADDISLPQRLERQYSYMENNPSVAAVGAHVFISENSGLINRGYCQDYEIDKIQMLFRNAGVAHPTAMFRKDFLVENQIAYNEKLKKSQDYGIFYEIVTHGGYIGCIEEILLRYRVHEGQISANNSDQMKYSNMVSGKALKGLIGEHDDNVLKLHCSLIDGVADGKKEDYILHLKKLMLHNEKVGIYPKKLFNYQLRSIWLRLCLKRIKYHHKFDFVFSSYTLYSLSLPVLLNYYNTYVACEKRYSVLKRKYLEANN